MNYFTEMKAEYNRISAKIASLERKINTLPEGSLEWRKKGDGFKYYRSLDHKKEYISKNKTELLNGLAKKKYLQKMLIDARAEKHAIGKYLSSHQEKDRAYELSQAVSFWI